MPKQNLNAKAKFEVQTFLKSIEDKISSMTAKELEIAIQDHTSHKLNPGVIYHFLRSLDLPKPLSSRKQTNVEHFTTIYEKQIQVLAKAYSELHQDCASGPIPPGIIAILNNNIDYFKA